MIDLLKFVEHFDPGSPHHRAAFIELQRHIPEEQLRRDSEWVIIYQEEPMELNEFSRNTN